jgi:hypothetical protein
MCRGPKRVKTHKRVYKGVAHGRYTKSAKSYKRVTKRATRSSPRIERKRVTKELLKERKRVSKGKYKGPLN